MSWAGGRRTLAVRGIGLALFLAATWIVPHRWCMRGAEAWYRGDPETQAALARGMERWISGDLTAAAYNTGSAKFDGEWLFGTYLMAGFGFGQSALEHPEWTERHAALMARCIDRILSPEVREFDRSSWGDDPIETLDGSSNHAAYLGYFNLLLGLHRRVDPASPYAGLNDRITSALARRLEKSPLFLLQTYPDEVYPVDNCAVAASIGLYDRVTGADHGALLRAWTERVRERYRDAATGLLIQAVDARTGAPIDAPRGSGTCLGAYFMSFSDPVFSGELYRAARRGLGGTFMGFGVVREYPPAFPGGRGDIDSGPIILGYGVSATGFCLAGARSHGDGDYHARLYATVHLYGAPRDAEGRREFVTGGPLGNAILFAMLTAPRYLGNAP
jgi:hypothetical protein